MSDGGGGGGLGRSKSVGGENHDRMQACRTHRVYDLDAVAVGTDAGIGCGGEDGRNPHEDRDGPHNDGPGAAGMNLDGGDCGSLRGDGDDGCGHCQSRQTSHHVRRHDTDALHIAAVVVVENMKSSSFLAATMTSTMKRTERYTVSTGMALGKSLQLSRSDSCPREAVQSI